MNYTTYYTRGQKVFLINTTPGRDETIFEAFSATIAACNNHHFELRPRYKLLQGAEGHPAAGMHYKVTTESHGSGVQFNGIIRSVTASSIMLQPTDLIEMYQRSQAPRMDLITSYQVFSKNAPLAVFHHEWHQLLEGLCADISEKLEFTAAQINLGIGGIRYITNTNDHQSDLAIVFIELEKGKPPVCAVAELLWRRALPDEDGTAVGRRFVLIHKKDQERLQLFIQQHQKKHGKQLKPRKNNWELLDRMLHVQ